MAFLTIDYVPNHPGNWKDRHAKAVRSRAIPVVEAIRAWCDYATVHKTLYGSSIGQDYVLGPAWAEWGRAMRTLLNGDLRGADAGTLDTILCGNLVNQGFTEAG